MVLRRDTEGTIKLVKDAKVAVFAQARVLVGGDGGMDPTVKPTVKVSDLLAHTLIVGVNNLRAVSLRRLG